ncbi:MAG: hypothetical protein A2298_00335 [Gammaproteobacteria bacterium RIFOXYB2_FULL_38_6]|nr:MAG: hypothetical protein A2298_00335 [Gammaproteobacteria bacterium RIFOXYB2_FULL_38_6]
MKKEETGEGESVTASAENKPMSEAMIPYDPLVGICYEFLKNGTLPSKPDENNMYLDTSVTTDSLLISLAAAMMPPSVAVPTPTGEAGSAADGDDSVHPKIAGGEWNGPKLK